jgi:two-component system cell cycle sensor histidine kinase/response regulator CckA
MTLENLTAEALARLGIEHTSDHLLVLDGDLRVRYVNRLVDGVTWEAALGSHALAYLPRDAHERVLEKLHGVLATGVPTSYETAFLSPNGRTLYFESRASVFETDEGVRGLVISTSDISSRKTELFDLERFFHLTDDLMAVLDGEGRILRVNRAFQQTLGYTEEALVCRSVLDLIHPDDAGTVRAMFRSDGKSVSFRARKADDSYALLQLKITADEASDRTIAVARDVTQARSIERQLLRSQRMDAIGQLAGGIAHDFNNLLTSVLVNTQLAVDELPPDHPVQELLDSVLHAGNLSADLTRQLLTMSRRDEGARGEVDVNELIEKLLAMLRRTIPETVDVDFIPGHTLPRVRAEAAQLEQVLLNLCLNARDAMKRGGRLTIATDTVIINGEYTRVHPWARPGRYVLIQVTDTGTGIPLELQERIFEPFFTTKEGEHGTGLGMTIAYEVVMRHEGLMHLYSEPGLGTTVKVYLPAAVAQASSIAGKPTGAVPAGGERILLAEDEPLVRAVMERVLRRGGYTVTSAADGKEALALLDAGGPFDLLVLDVVMPTMGGADVARVLQARGAEIPILLSSGYSKGALDAPDVREIPLLLKPFDPDTLLRMVRQGLDGASGD